MTNTSTQMDPVSMQLLSLLNITTFIVYILGLFFILYTMLRIFRMIVAYGIYDYFVNLYWRLRREFSTKRIYILKEKIISCDDIDKAMRIEKRVESHINFLKRFEPQSDDTEYDEEPHEVNSDMMELSHDVLEFIDTVIHLEIVNAFVQYTTTNKKIDVLQSDKYIKDISTNVIECLSDDIFQSRFVFRPEFIHFYVVKKVTEITITFIVTHNERIS